MRNLKAAKKPKPGWTERMINTRPLYRKVKGRGEFALRKTSGQMHVPSQTKLRSPWQNSLTQKGATVVMWSAVAIMLYCVCMSGDDYNDRTHQSEVNYEEGVKRSMAAVTLVSSMFGTRALQQDNRRTRLLMPTLSAVIVCTGWYWRWMDWSESAAAFASWLSVALAAAIHIKSAAYKTWNEWIHYWTEITALEDALTMYRAMNVKWLCNDGEVRESLFDTEAAASLVPTSRFKIMCTSVHMRPSRLRLRAANGQAMNSEGVAPLQLRLPGMTQQEDPIIEHDFEVMPPGAMPAHLKILGVDFWDKLNPNVQWSKRNIHCTAPDGREFDLPFTVQHKMPTTIKSCLNVGTKRE